MVKITSRSGEIKIMLVLYIHFPIYSLIDSETVNCVILKKKTTINIWHNRSNKQINLAINFIFIFYGNIYTFFDSIVLISSYVEPKNVQ